MGTRPSTFGIPMFLCPFLESKHDEKENQDASCHSCCVRLRGDVCQLCYSVSENRLPFEEVFAHSPLFWAKSSHSVAASRWIHSVLWGRCHHLDLLLADFARLFLDNTYDWQRRALRRTANPRHRNVSPALCLGLVLSFYRSRAELHVLCLASGIIPSCASWYLAFAHLILKVISSLDPASLSHS